MIIHFKNCAQKEENVSKKVYGEVKFLKNLEIFGMTDKTRRKVKVHLWVKNIADFWRF